MTPVNLQPFCNVFPSTWGHFHSFCHLRYWTFGILPFFFIDFFFSVGFLLWFFVYSLTKYMSSLTFWHWPSLLAQWFLFAWCTHYQGWAIGIVLVRSWCKSSPARFPQLHRGCSFCRMDLSPLCSIEFSTVRSKSNLRQPYSYSVSCSYFSPKLENKYVVFHFLFLICRVLAITASKYFPFPSHLSFPSPLPSVSISSSPVSNAFSPLAFSHSPVPLWNLCLHCQHIKCWIMWLAILRSGLVLIFSVFVIYISPN